MSPFFLSSVISWGTSSLHLSAGCTGAHSGLLFILLRWDREALEDRTPAYTPASWCPCRGGLPATELQSSLSLLHVLQSVYLVLELGTLLWPAAKPPFPSAPQCIPRGGEWTVTLFKFCLITHCTHSGNLCRVGHSLQGLLLIFSKKASLGRYAGLVWEAGGRLGRQKVMGNY